jgi:hypothetical protein
MMKNGKSAPKTHPLIKKLVEYDVANVSIVPKPR